MNSDKRAIQQEIIAGLTAGELTLGQAVKRIRKDLHGVPQAKYAAMCQVSEKTLRDIEKDHTDPRLSIAQRLLHLGGMGLTTYLKKNRVQPMAEYVQKQKDQKLISE